VNYGYGPDGETVQACLHGKGLTDRVIMQRTLLTGWPTITGKMVCQKIRSSNSSGKKAMKEEVWLKIMEAGLPGCEVAWLDNKRVVMKAIPVDPAAKISYHNGLMRLCAVSLRELVEAMQKAKAKYTEKVAAREAEADRRSRSRSRRE